LWVTDPGNDKTRIEDTKGGLLRESYCWILEHADFQRWRNDEQSRLRNGPSIEKQLETAK